MTICTLAILTRLLLFAPPPAAPSAASELPPAPAVKSAATETSSLHQVAQLLKQAVALGDEDPEAAVPLLEQALLSLTNFTPLFAAEPDLVEIRGHAQVSLARAHLLAGRDAEAAAAMDEAIRSALGQPLPVAAYGPSIEALWLERSRHAQDNPGRPVVVQCAMDCRVYLNERRVPPEELSGLTVGVYRLWVDAADNPDQQVRREIEVTKGTIAIRVTVETDDDTLTLVYGPAPAEVHEAVLDAPPPERPEQEPKRKPKAPRWVKIVSMSVGAGLLVSGGVLLSLDGKCQGGGAATADNVDTCTKVWTNAGPGYGLLAGGGGLLVGATVWLSVAEARASRGRHISAMVGWTMRF